jgi:hypothetical protein
MLMTKERRPAIRTLRGWAISVLQEAGAIRECEEHGWATDRADPHASTRLTSPVRTRPVEFRRTKRQQRCGTFLIQSATPVPNVRPKTDYRAADFRTRLVGLRTPRSSFF